MNKSNRCTFLKILFTFLGMLFIIGSLSFTSDAASKRTLKIEKVNGKNVYYCIKEGKKDAKYTGFVEYKKAKYYVNKGKANIKKNGFVKYKGKYYLLSKGKINTKKSGLIKKDKKTTLYIKKGIQEVKYTGGVKNGSKVQYVKKGVLDKKYIGGAKYGKKLIYMRNGVFDKKYSGYTKYNGAIYKVKNGILEKKTSLSSTSYKAIEKASKYTYSITPMLAPFNNYFFVKTDNPDVSNLVFVDTKTSYDKKQGQIVFEEKEFADVKYEKKKTLRVKGGYIFKGQNTDGGDLKLMVYTKSKKIGVTDLGSGEVTYETLNSDEVDTGITVKCAKVKNLYDYLYDNYANISGSYFDMLSNVQKGLEEICLYSGAYVLGDLVKSTSSPYYGFSTSPHADAPYIIQSPYSRKDSKRMLTSYLYPAIADSLGFPSIMWNMAKKIDSSASVSWDGYYHYLVKVTYKGETRSYGGAGIGEGQGIPQNYIKYLFKFDGTATDFYKGLTVSKLKNAILEYGKMQLPKEQDEQPVLTWTDVANTVGDGAYVKLVVLSGIFGSASDGYSYMYENEFNNLSEMSDAWYDGRYFNKWEFFEKGAKFSDYSTASIIIKNPAIELPSGWKSNYSINGKRAEEYYDPATRTWKGYYRYMYDSTSDSWISDLYYYFKDNADNNPSFKDACIITREEAAAMNLDKNTNINPASGYVFNMKEKPGTRF